MAHVRKQIRDAAATALAGLVTTGSNVFPSLTYNLSDSQIPGLKIFTTNDRFRDFLTVDYPRRVERELDLIIEGYAKVNDIVDDTLDAIGVEVENTLSAENANNDNLNGLTKDLYFDSAYIPLDNAENTIGMIRMTFKAIYNIAENDCETALN